MPVDVFSLTCLLEFLMDIDFEVRFGNAFQRNHRSTAGAIVENDFITFDPDNASTKVSLSLEGHAGLQLGRIARKPFIISAFVKAALDTGRGNLERGLY